MHECGLSFRLSPSIEVDCFLFDPVTRHHRSDVRLLGALEYDLVVKLVWPVFVQPIDPCTHIFGFEKCRGDFVD